MPAADQFERELDVECAFCSLENNRPVLWESDHYRLLADAYPVCAGHTLLIPKDHLPSHMHAPREWMSEFRKAREHLIAFFRDTFGQCSFWENGGKWQDVPHAHLHGFPWTSSIVEPLHMKWLRPVSSWDEVRSHCQSVGHYLYVENHEGGFVLADDENRTSLIEWARRQVIRQTGCQTDPQTGAIIRGGPETSAETLRLWTGWRKLHVSGI